MSPIKAIKIGLPVATATSAAIATTSLVSFSKKDEIQKEEDLDKGLSDLSIPDEKYEDKELFYSKDGDGKNQEVLDKALAEKLSKLLKEKGDLSSIKGPTPDLSKIDLDKIKKNAPTSHGEGVEHNNQQDSQPPIVNEVKPEEKVDQAHSSEVGASPSPDDGKQSPQISVTSEVKDDVPKGNMNGEREENGDDGNTEKSPELGLGRQESNPEDESAKQVTEDLGQESENSQESDNSTIGGKSETPDTETSSSSKPLGDSTGNVFQTKEEAEEHGKQEIKGNEGFDSRDTNPSGQDSHFKAQQQAGTDSVGNGEEFTEDDLRKWSELGDQLSSVSDKLMSLIQN